MAVIDALADIDIQCLKPVLTSDAPIKVIHNAAFDTSKLAKFYKIVIDPVFDTMIAARHNREKKYSLAAQSAIHLNIHLNKNVQKSDWSRRPLDLRQLDYAALDSVAALFLYEHQRKRNLTGYYRSKAHISSLQTKLEFTDLHETKPLISNEMAAKDIKSTSVKPPSPGFDPLLPVPHQAILSIINKLPTRFSPEQLAVSVGIDWIGVAGWIIDSLMGSDTDLDVASARLILAELFDQKLIELSETGRLLATKTGTDLLEKLDQK